MNTDDQIRLRTRQAMLSALRAAVALLAATLVFFVVPVDGLALDRVVIVALVFAMGLAGVAALVVRQVISYRHAARSGRARLLGLMVAIYLTVLFFALAYYLLSMSHPGQIEDLSTRTDALYFALSIVTTVGLGDVHAVGQAARSITSLQMVFDLVFVSLAVSAVRAPASAMRGEVDGS